MHNVFHWILAAVLCGTALAGDTAQVEPAVDPRFEFLKSLAGRWVGASSEDGAPPHEIEFRLTAHGTAVEEKEMVGTPHEMLTVYHLDGGDLVGTHYCMLGNQPRVRAAERVVEGTLRFDCAGTPGNARSHDDEHVHGWTMRLDPDGRLHYTAELRKGAETTETPVFVLTRR